MVQISIFHKNFIWHLIISFKLSGTRAEWSTHNPSLWIRAAAKHSCFKISLINLCNLSGWLPASLYQTKDLNTDHNGTLSNGSVPQQSSHGPTFKSLINAYLLYLFVSFKHLRPDLKVSSRNPTCGSQSQLSSLWSHKCILEQTFFSEFPPTTTYNL